MKQNISVRVNNVNYEKEIDIRMSLLEFLREELELCGAKEGCSVGECGACTVIMDGQSIDACISLAVWADGKAITTIEGITHEDGSLSDMQENFVDAGAVQCGFCIPGLVVSAEALLQENPNPSRDEIRRGLSGNLCRCTGYVKVVDAVERTAQSRQGK